MGQILMRDERRASTSGVVSSRHCHMSPASPFSWNLWTWSAYLGKRQSHVNSQQGLKHAGGQDGRDLKNTQLKRGGCLALSTFPTPHPHWIKDLNPN